MNPEEYIVSKQEDLIEKVFPNLKSKRLVPEDLIDGAIYTPLNADVKCMNDICMKLLPGKSKCICQQIQS